MKKQVSLALSALSAFALLGATMVKIDDPKVGEVAYSGFGRLAYVDVFSTNDTGTVKLDRVFNTVTYTNAYDITTSTETNIVETPVFGDLYFVRQDGVAYTNVETESSASVFYASVQNDDDYIQYMEGRVQWYAKYATKPLKSFTLRHADSKTDWDVQDPEKITKDLFDGIEGYSYRPKRDVIRTDVTTNIVTHVTTNAVRAVKCYDLEVTNNVFNGSCSGKFFRGTPETEFWMFKGDRLLFNGTATGGALRLVIE